MFLSTSYHVLLAMLLLGTVAAFIVSRLVIPAIIAEQAHSKEQSQINAKWEIDVHDQSILVQVIGDFDHADWVAFGFSDKGEWTECDLAIVYLKKKVVKVSQFGGSSEYACVEKIPTITRFMVTTTSQYEQATEYHYLRINHTITYDVPFRIISLLL